MNSQLPPETNNPTELWPANEPPPTKTVLPFSRWYPLGAGVLAGLCLRFLFSGEPGGSWSAMAGSFIYFSPIIVGAVTVYIAEKIKRRKIGRAHV